MKNFVLFALLALIALALSGCTQNSSICGDGICQSGEDCVSDCSLQDCLGDKCLESIIVKNARGGAANPTGCDPKPTCDPCTEKLEDCKCVSSGNKNSSCGCIPVNDCCPDCSGKLCGESDGCNGKCSGPCSKGIDCTKKCENFECVPTGKEQCTWPTYDFRGVPIGDNIACYDPKKEHCCDIGGPTPIDEKCGCKSDGDCEWCLEECRGIFSGTCEPISGRRICDGVCSDIAKGDCCPNEVKCRYDPTCHPKGHVCECYDDADCAGSGCDYICDKSKGECTKDPAKQKCKDGTCVGVKDCCPENKCQLDAGNCTADWFGWRSCDCPNKFINIAKENHQDSLSLQCKEKCRPNCGTAQASINSNGDCLIPPGGYCGDQGTLTCSCK